MKHEFKIPSEGKYDHLITDLVEYESNQYVQIPPEIIDLAGSDFSVKWNWKTEGNILKYDVQFLFDGVEPHHYRNFHFNKQGDRIEGILDSIVPNKHPKWRGQNIYNIQIDTGEIYSVFGSYDIDKNISLDNLGDKLSIEYLGKLYDKTGKYTKTYEVCIE